MQPALVRRGSDELFVIKGMDHYAPLVFGLGADVFLPRLAGTAVQGGPATEIQGNMMAHNFQKKKLWSVVVPMSHWHGYTRAYAHV